MSPQRLLSRLWFLLLLLWSIGCVGWSLYQAGRVLHSGFSLVRVIRGTYRSPTQVPRGELRPLVVTASSDSLDTLDLPAQSRSLFFLYDRNCLFCNRNTPRWLELMAALQGSGVTIYGLAPKSSVDQAAYWHGLGRRLKLAVPLRDSMLLEEFGTASTPSTIVVRDGQVDVMFIGVLSRWQQSTILQELGPE
jgi:hypothetical protein